MKIKTSILLGSVLSVTMFSPSGVLKAAEAPVRATPDDNVLKAEETHNTHDHEILARLHILNMHVIRLSQRAIYQSNSEGVKKLARKLLEDHLTLDQALMNTAIQHDFYPGRIIANMEDTPMLRQEHRDVMTRLGKLKGAAFDKLFLDTMIRIHEAERMRLETTAHDIREKDVQRYVDRVLPMMQEHAEAARSLRPENHEGRE